MKKYILPLCLIFFYSSCIDQIDLDTKQEDPLIVIDGVFSDLEETQTINIFQSLEVDVQTPFPVKGALVYVEDQNGNRIAFTEQDDGSYQVEAQAEPGKQYRLYAILPDDRIITSNLQKVPNSFPIDNISIADTTVNILNESGNRLRINAIDFYAQGTAYNVPEKQYLRFRYETVFQVSELICSPLVPPNTCYIYNDTRPNSINLLKVDQSSTPISYTNFVYRRKIDTSLGEIFALDLSLYAYNKKEYEYWERMKSIFDQSGNITDNIPARLSGNIMADDGSEVLGQFAVVGKSRKIKTVVNADFSFIALPLCGLPGLQPYPTPDACCNCLSLANANLVKPDYWP